MTSLDTAGRKIVVSPRNRYTVVSCLRLNRPSATARGYIRQPQCNQACGIATWDTIATPESGLDVLVCTTEAVQVLVRRRRRTQTIREVVQKSEYDDNLLESCPGNRTAKGTADVSELLTGLRAALRGISTCT